MWLYSEKNDENGHYLRAINMDDIVAVTLYYPVWEITTYSIWVRTLDGIAEEICSTTDRNKALKKYYRLKEMLNIKGVTL